eukprot:CAMPEP_0178383490 /NCGR_PEP_ID=MMETSP0689_2-20121128/7028_1 /TAXON_ID=160604 /ORGANISM="Amphidinium massartii, Strain CS-259" /LENGTH=466 /DNA_ID=CAMNT_0020003711 /DNA_START=280 /DNA_END=1677 /DNA_ORIENTATION=+
MALSNGIMGLAVPALRLLGATYATWLVILFRMFQGVAFALYIAANTSLITRFFPQDVAYILALIEVFVGIGAQLGRLIGGIIFDHTGFAGPFFSIACFQAITAIAGLGFQRQDLLPKRPNAPSSLGTETSCDSIDSVPSADGRVEVSWWSLMLPRVFLGMAGVWLNFFQAGFYDATLSPQLKEHLQLRSTTIISVFMALRSSSYLATSYVSAELLKHRRVSYEMLSLAGAICCSLGFILIPPQPLVATAFQKIFGASYAGLCGLQSVALLIGASGPASLFVPSLPLMQHEVQHLGRAAVEQTTALFMSMMSIGEALGPIVGGWMVQHFGFQQASAIAMIPYALDAVFASAMLSHSGSDINASVDNLDNKAEAPTAADHLGCPTGSSENKVVWQLLHTQLEEHKGTTAISSVPSTMWRRKYSPLLQRKRCDVPSTAPSTTWRKKYSSSWRSKASKTGLSEALLAPGS